MCKRLSLLRGRKGSAAVIMALGISTVMAFGAMVFDIGSVMLERQRLQNAVDAACLAAAMELPDTDEAREKAEYYAQANGVDPEDIDIDFADSNKTVDITANRKVEFFLARILGVESADTAANAAATLDSIGGAFNYSIFSGSTTQELGLFGSNINITGSSHTNKNFISSASNLKITGACEAATTVAVYGSNIDVKDRRPNSPLVEMPDFSETIRLQAEAAGQSYIGDKVFSGSNITLNSPVYVQGNVTIAASNFSGKGCILATGNITMGVSNMTMSSDSAVCFYSKNGNITISGSNVNLSGIYYAPKGRVGLYASNLTVNGKVIGNTVSSSASNLNITGNTGMMSSLPSQGIRLIR